MLAYPNAKPDKSYTIPDNMPIKRYGTGGYYETPFSNCLALQSLEVSSENEHYYSEDGVLYEKNENSNNRKYIAAFPGGKTEYELSDNVWGTSALTFARGLKSVSASENHDVYASKDGVLYSKTMNALIVYPRGKTDAEFTLPDTVNSDIKDSGILQSGIHYNPYLKTAYYKGKSYTPSNWDSLYDLYNAITANGS